MNAHNKTVCARCSRDLAFIHWENGQRFTGCMRRRRHQQTVKKATVRRYTFLHSVVHRRCRRCCYVPSILVHSIEAGRVEAQATMFNSNQFECVRRFLNFFCSFFSLLLLQTHFSPWLLFSDWSRFKSIRTVWLHLFAYAFRTSVRISTGNARSFSQITIVRSLSRDAHWFGCSAIAIWHFFIICGLCDCDVAYWHSSHSFVCSKRCSEPAKMIFNWFYWNICKNVAWTTLGMGNQMVANGHQHHNC